jgi:hypothetical protein
VCGTGGGGGGGVTAVAVAVGVADGVFPIIVIQHKNGFYNIYINAVGRRMDPPKTRRESKKDQKEKAKGRDGKYTQKHIRAVEVLKEKRK